MFSVGMALLRRLFLVLLVHHTSCEDVEFVLLGRAGWPCLYCLLRNV
jgi:hypothetical protein